MFHRPQGHRREVRAFSLIETMVVVAILGVIAALAAPSFQPLVAKAELGAAAEQVSSFFHLARMRAMSDRRCTRVTIDALGPPAVLRAEVLNSYDCGDSENGAQQPSNAPKIEGSLTWKEFRRIRIGKNSIQVDWYDSGEADWSDDDISTGEASPIAAPHAAADSRLEVRYRPTGRHYSWDNNVTNDDAIIVLNHNRLPNDRYAVLLESHGRICALRRNVLPGGTPNNRTCP